MQYNELFTVTEESSYELPIYGVYCADENNVPFYDLYYDMFPEQYDVE